jgi:hypothetical protein
MCVLQLLRPVLFSLSFIFWHIESIVEWITLCLIAGPQASMNNLIMQVKSKPILFPFIGAGFWSQANPMKTFYTQGQIYKLFNLHDKLL